MFPIDVIVRAQKQFLGTFIYVDRVASTSHPVEMSVCELVDTRHQVVVIEFEK
jgi:hypothetical protein